MIPGSTIDAPPDRLSSRRRWRLAWALMWPASLFDLLFWLAMVPVQHYRWADTIRSIGGVVFFFLLAPWIVRRTVRLSFPDFHLVAIRMPASEETRAINYRESLAVTWLLAWRTVAVAFVLIFPVFLAILVLRWTPSGRLLPGGPVVSGFIESVGSNLLGLLIFYLWLVSAAIRKTYSGFVLRVREAPAESCAPPLDL